jgi:uncharacterized membrane protein YczE
MKKVSFYSELAYIIGIVGLALGTAFMEKANLGISMVVAPAYLLYLKLSQVWVFVTFGMAEYAVQACLLIVMVIVLRKFKLSFLFSFVTAVIYGFTLDCCMALATHIDASGFASRIMCYLIGFILCAIGVAFIFHTYIAPEAYELFVKEVSGKTHIKISRFKTGYDCVSCMIGITLSFLFFGLFHFEGVKLGTIICALVNGKAIGLISKYIEKHFDFVDVLPFRKYF